MNQREVWTVNLSPQVGDEINNIRPCVVINPNNFGALELQLVIPITHTRKVQKPWHVPLYPSLQNGLIKDSLADCFQIISISNLRFISKIGELSDIEMFDIKLTLVRVLDLV